MVDSGDCYFKERKGDEGSQGEAKKQATAIHLHKWRERERERSAVIVGERVMGLLISLMVGIRSRSPFLFPGSHLSLIYFK